MDAPVASSPARQAEAFPTPTEICLGRKLRFPAYGEDSLISNVLFITGKRGSGKSFTAGVMMEEFHRLGLQFVCFDALDAHGGLDQMPRVESIKPEEGQSIDMKSLVQRLKTTDKSLVIKMGGLSLTKQQELIGDYCEALIEARIGKGLHTIFEECQDFIPQVGRPISFDPIVRLCKLGRALGYGATLVSQRPAGVNKEALSQASVYLVHNVINNRDLKTLDEQLSFGTDKRLIKKILNGISSARKGECVAYAPEFFRDRGYIVIDKIRGDRQTEHTGNNIDVQSMIGDNATSESSGDLFDGETPIPADAIGSISDAESFARHSSPLNPQSPPNPVIPEIQVNPLDTSPQVSDFSSEMKNYDDWQPSLPQFEYDPYDSESLETSLEDWETYSPPSGSSHRWVPVAAIGGTALTSALLLVVMRGLRIR